MFEHCGKYTVGYGVWRGSNPWPCEDRAGVLIAPAGGVVVAVEGTVLQAWRGDVPRIMQSNGTMDECIEWMKQSQSKCQKVESST